MILDCGHPDNGDLCTVHERDCTYHGQGVCVCPTVCPACCPECRPIYKTYAVVPIPEMDASDWEAVARLSP